MSETSVDFWHGRPVLVTGATGLLGSWLVPALHRRGADVTVLVRDALPRSLLVADGWLDKVNVVRGSLSDDSLLRRTFAEYGIQTVFHLGAQTLVGVAKVDPLGTLEANVRGTWLLLEAARQAKVPQVIVASSDKAYGDSTQLPYREDHPLQGRFPYDCSKSCADLISTMYAQTYGLGVAIARCGNLFGGGDLNFSRLIPGVIMATLRGQPFQIRSNGQFVRDFLYVEDAVQAYLELAQGLAADAGLAGQAFNFGLELRPTMLDLTHKVLAIMERSDLPPQVLNVASAEICEQTLDATKARTVLGWKARHGMDDGLRRTVDWYSRHFELLSTQR
ncbi:MAG: NAD-dependent epimerase/dehydratase family protein [Rhodoferax sp.]|nr:NAD-dependent epimerase/dehydratase family protein [Rhodoferax sp.]MCB2007319.1 NAD-dependent epimerase/dehydratase family protein [Rhodoferax sp.]MCB2028773.1 NAD-dependent epimerase/dehydratase family protein [Rhodoferax sp.]MCB2042669.1 NAD-dependent epimerase/dehydratase family protein [Rhodoferax sp.]MCP5262173.1 NAD-dependent epimerase/dehydratase family protein [Rhodoferax sp.]